MVNTENEIKKKVIKAIYSAIDDVNKMLPREARLSKSVDSIIIGRKSILDSLGVVNLIVAVEARIAEEFGFEITLVDARNVAGDGGPLSTLGALVDYISNILEGKRDG